MPYTGADVDHANSYSIQELAKLGGVSSKTIYRWLKKNDIPGAFMDGAWVRFHRKIIDTWMKSDPFADTREMAKVMNERWGRGKRKTRERKAAANRAAKAKKK